MVLVAVLMGTAPVVYAQAPRDLYTRALAQDRAVRDARQTPTLRQIRTAVASYERVVRRYPASGYADNALWQGSELSRLAWERFGEDADKRTGVRLLKQLKAGYSSSSLLPGIEPALARFEVVKATPTSRTAAATSAAATDPPPSAAVIRPASKSVEDTGPVPPGIVTVRGISRTPLPDGVRVSLAMDRELHFRQEQWETPKRGVVDLRGAHVSP
ncbi:MAG: N-acetylmuramoyl-L-alanine amidase, partial [Acidobacteriota bacterium]|nr:N-acetylmuramoyl-L-alanine amidase [Acidobacteriota bacterium]